MSRQQWVVIILRLIRALDARDWKTFTSYTVDGVTNYFGHRNASNAFIRKDIEGDAQTYRWSKSHPDLSTFQRSVRDGIVYEWVEERTESLEYSGRYHHARCRLEVSYKDDERPEVYSLSLKVLR
jgi:hypothetical protein